MNFSVNSFKHTLPIENCELCKQDMLHYIWSEIRSIKYFIRWEELIAMTVILTLFILMFGIIGLLLGLAFCYLMGGLKGGAVAGVFPPHTGYSEHNYCNKCEKRLKMCLC